MNNKLKVEIEANIVSATICAFKDAEENNNWEASYVIPKIMNYMTPHLLKFINKNYKAKKNETSKTKKPRRSKQKAV